MDSGARGVSRREWHATINGKRYPTHGHPIWTNIGELARREGAQGGTVFAMMWRLVRCLREGLVPDFDVQGCKGRPRGARRFARAAAIVRHRLSP